MFTPLRLSTLLASSPQRRAARLGAAAGSNVRSLPPGLAFTPPVRLEMLEHRRLMSSVVGFALINADTDQVIRPLNQGDTIDIAATPRVNVEALVSQSAFVVESVRFDLDGQNAVEVQNSAPYTIAGEDGADYLAWTLPAVGPHVLKATPYSGNKLSGTAGTSHEIGFTVINSTGPVVPPPGGDDGSAGVTYSAPITISTGGIYRGNWESLDASKPAVTIATSAPVVIENSNLRGKSTLIHVQGGVSADLTVRNVRGLGLNPNVNGRYPGRFVYAHGFKRVVVENSYMESTSGIYLGEGAAGATVKVLRNVAKNIDGRRSNGNGGWQDGDGSSSDPTFYRVQFVQVNQSVVPGMEIAWNQVINEAYKSRVEDNISIHRSRGTADNPIRVHDNYIRGAYPADPVNDKFSGGGIIVDGGWSSTRGESAYVHIYNNTVVDTTNYGIAIATGHDGVIYNNRVVSDGRLPDGRLVKAINVGIYVWDYSDQAPTHYYRNSAHDNVSGWMNSTGRNDYWLPDDDETLSHDNARLPSGAITAAMELVEFDLWQAKLLQSAVVVGQL